MLQLSKADACIVIADQASSANVRWANNTSTTNGTSSTHELLVVSVIGRRVGTVARNYFPPDRLESIVRESEAACEGRPDAEDYMPLLDGDGTADAWSDPPERTGIGVFDGFASGLADLFTRAERGGIKLFGYAEHTTSTVHLATSTGVRGRHTRRQGRLELNAKSQDLTRSTWVGLAPTTFDGLDLDVLWDRLESRIGWSRAQLSLDPGQYEVLLEPSCVADMVVYAYWSSSRRDADEGRTVFSKPGGGNRVGEKLYGDAITICSDPGEPGLETAPFDVSPASSSYSSVFDNGLPVTRTDWVSNGILQELLTTRHWAQVSGSQRAAPYVHNLVMPAEGPSMEEMIASSERALLLNCLWYIREVDPQTLLLTGLTRDGVWLVENGRVKGAVNNFRYNMSPVAMLAQTVEIGRTEQTLCREWADYFPFTKVPPLRVEGWNMSSVSQAT